MCVFCIHVCIYVCVYVYVYIHTAIYMYIFDQGGHSTFLNIDEGGVSNLQRMEVFSYSAMDGGIHELHILNLTTDI